MCKIRHSSCLHGFIIREALINLSLSLPHMHTLSYTYVQGTVTGTDAMEEEHKAFKESRRGYLTWSGRSGMASQRNGCSYCDLKDQ